MPAKKPPDVESFRYWCREGAARLGVELTGEQLDIYVKYYLFLFAKSEKFNLTAIKGEKETALLHFVDSLACLQAVPLEGPRQVVDVGTGAGFPGLPVKIVRPQVSLVLVDSSLKKVSFVTEAIGCLGLVGARAVHGRAEDLAHKTDMRARFEVVLSRAVAPLPVLAELCLAFLGPGGLFVAFKGPAGAEEEKKSANVLKVMGGALKDVKEFVLPFYGHPRRLIVVEKIAPTPPQYPRRAGVPARRPI